jgi:hypothetical protein
MKTKVKKFFNRYGLCLSETDKNPFSYSPNEYINADDEKIRTHREFLRSLEAGENDRLALIENKSSQLVSQTGIIFSLLSLFIPIFIDKVSGQILVFRLLFLVLLVLAFAFYVLTVRNAIKNLNIKNFNYSTPSPNDVIKYQDKSPKEFSAIEIKALLHGANQNTKMNNKKGTNLIHSYNSFKTANFFTALLVILICSSLLLFSKPKKDSVTIENPIQIEHFDSTMSSIIKTLNEKRLSQEPMQAGKTDTAK